MVDAVMTTSQLEKEGDAAKKQSDTRCEQGGDINTEKETTGGGEDGERRWRTAAERAGGTALLRDSP